MSASPNTSKLPWIFPRASRLPWLSLVLAAAFALFAFVNAAQATAPSEFADWPLKVSLGFILLFLGLAHVASRSTAE